GGLAFEPDAASLGVAEEAPAQRQHRGFAFPEPVAQLRVAVERRVASEALRVPAAHVVAAADAGRLEPGVAAPRHAPARTKRKRERLVSEESREAAVDPAEGGRRIPGPRRVEAVEHEANAADLLLRGGGAGAQQRPLRCEAHAAAAGVPIQ